MIKRSQIVLIALIPLILSSFMHPGPAMAAQSHLTRIATLEDFGYTSDDTVHGSLVTRDYTIRWPFLWEPEPGISFTLRFSHSPILDQRSTLSVDLNGTRLGSTILSPSNVRDGSLKVEIPEKLIKPGYNQLRLSFFMGIEDFDCVDDEDPAIWATVHSTSTFDFRYTLLPPDPELSAFPQPFLDSSPLMLNQITLIYPEQPSIAELNAAALVSAKIGQLARGIQLDLRHMSQDAFSIESQKNGFLIFIGRADHLDLLKNREIPLEWDSAASALESPSGERLDPELGILWEGISPFDANALILVVTGTTDQAVIKGGRAVADDQIPDLLSGPLGMIRDVPAPSPSTVSLGQTLSLADLGYEDEVGYGTSEQKVGVFEFHLTQAWQFISDAELLLHFAHTTIVSPEDSFLTIILNDTPVASVHLVPENAESATELFQLPKEIFVPGKNQLSYISNMQFEHAVDDYRYGCHEDEYTAAWLVIYNDTMLNFPGGTTGSLSLSKFPPAFVGTADLSDLAFVVAPQPDHPVIDIVLSLSQRIGLSTPSSALALKVFDTDMLDSAEEVPEHQILIGLPNQHDAIAQLNDRLPQPFVPGTNTPAPIEDLAQVIPPKEGIGYIQALLDEQGHPRLVVTGNSPEGLRLAGLALVNPELSVQISGDLVVVPNESTVAAAKVQSEDELQPTVPEGAISLEKIERDVQSDRMRTFAVVLFALTFIVLALLALPPTLRRLRRT